MFSRNSTAFESFGKGKSNMLEKLINTLKYGSVKTKRKIYTILGFFIVGIGLLIASIVLSNWIFGILAAAVIFIDGLILANTSFEQKSISVKKGAVALRNNCTILLAPPLGELSSRQARLRGFSTK